MERQRMRGRTTAADDAARVRRVVAFALETGCPREAWSWLLRLSREAGSRRAAGAAAGEANAAEPLPVLPAPGGFDR
jgi:hypothetical protein